MRLNQRKLADAEKLFAEARSKDPARRDIEEGYRNAKFWGIMNQAADALTKNRPKDAAAEYQQAVLQNPADKDALLGLASASVRAGDYPTAARTYYRLTPSIPGDESSWLGLIQAQSAENDPQAAIATSQRIPPDLRQRMEASPGYPAQMALVFYSAHELAEGDRALLRALEIARDSDTEEAFDLRIQIAGAFMNQGSPERAVEIYKEATLLHPGNSSGGKGWWAHTHTWVTFLTP